MGVAIAVIGIITICYFVLGFVVAMLEGSLSRKNRGHRVSDMFVITAIWPVSVLFWIGTL